MLAPPLVVRPTEFLGLCGTLASRDLAIGAVTP